MASFTIIYLQMTILKKSVIPMNINDTLKSNIT